MAEAAPEAPIVDDEVSMLKWHNRVALVTGASSGIGIAICEMLVTRGMTVAAIAKTLDQLEAKNVEFRSNGMPGTLIPMYCDISSHDNVAELFHDLKSDPDIGGVDLCVHAANVGYAESLLTGSPEQWAYMIGVNILGPAIVTQEAVKSMREREISDGHLVFINSLAGHRIIPGNKDLHMYCCTRYAITAMIEGLRLELRQSDSPIRVSAISPGVVETDIFHKLFEGDEEKAKKFLAERQYLLAKNIADSLEYIISQPPRVEVHDILMRSSHQIP